MNQELYDFFYDDSVDDYTPDYIIRFGERCPQTGLLFPDHILFDSTLHVYVQKQLFGPYYLDFKSNQVAKFKPFSDKIGIYGRFFAHAIPKRKLTNLVKKKRLKPQGNFLLDLNPTEILYHIQYLYLE